jgi:hypothetical protein
LSFAAARSFSISASVSDKDAHKRSDDLLDAAVYAASIAFRPRLAAK